MGSELWEIVRADQVKVGDVIRSSACGLMAREISDFSHPTPNMVQYRVNVTSEFALNSQWYTARANDMFFRRYTGPSLEALTLALRKVIALDVDPEWIDETVKLWIEDAQAEVAKEQQP